MTTINLAVFLDAINVITEKNPDLLGTQIIIDKKFAKVMLIGLKAADLDDQTLAHYQREFSNESQS